MTETERIILDQLLEETYHVIQFTDTEWIIAHPLRERLNGSLFDCRILWNDGDPGVRGRYVLQENGDLGEEYYD